MIACHQAGVWRYLRALGCDACSADDLTQETFLEVMKRPFVQYNEQATSAYLRRVAHNLFITLKRRSGKVIYSESADDFETSWMRWAGFDGGNRALEALEDCFSRLTGRAQQALRMRFADEANRQTIADELNISEHGAKNLMQRAKTQLRECVESKLK
ncbi:MAG: RNA polymerase sigma factor [Pirellulaceae bacterium]|nr:RNA polymerase sigma factor [Pirellulaceae bacterium]